MPLLNYTTTVGAERTALQIQAALVKAGARSVMTTYDDRGRAIGLAFSAITEFGPRSFVLPVDPEPVLLAMRKSGAPRRFLTSEQAERVAWRIIKDWTEAQLALIETAMVTLDQVMLPYMQTELGGSVWELYAASGGGSLRALDAGPTDDERR